MPWKIRTYWPGLVAVIFWGLSYNWSKICFEYYTPLSTIFIRLLLSTLFLFAYLQMMRRDFSIRPSDIKWLLITAFFSPFLYFIGENYGLDLTTPTTTSVLISTIPLFTPIAAWFAYRERLTMLNFLGIFISFVGIVLLLLNPQMKISGNPGGLFLLLLAVASAVGYSLIIRRLAETYRPMVIIAWQNIIGMLFFLPFFLAFDLSDVLSTRPDARLVISISALAILGSSIAFIMFVRVIKEIGVSKTSVLSNLIPLVTAFTALVLGQETFSIKKTLAMAVIIMGVLMSQLPSLRLKHPK